MRTSARIGLAVCGSLALLTLACVVTPELVIVENKTVPIQFSGWGSRNADITIEMFNHNTDDWEEVAATQAGEDGWFSIDVTVPGGFWSPHAPPPQSPFRTTTAEVFNNGNHLKTAAEVNGNGTGIIVIVCGPSCI